MSKRLSWQVWRRAHAGKRSFPTVWAAHRAALRVILREPAMKHRHLRGYECRWGSDWRAGKSYPAHYHIGHSSKTWRGKHRWWKARIVKRLIVWPFFRARRVMRSWPGGALIKLDGLGHKVRLARPLGLCRLLDTMLDTQTRRSR